MEGDSSNMARPEPDGDLGIPSALLGLVIPHGICTVFILARIVARTLLLKKWFLDDTLIIGAFLFSSAVCVIYSIASQRPDVLHADEQALQANMDADDWTVHPYILRTYLGLLFYQVCLCLTKFSILSFYLRIFSSSPKHRMVVLGTMVFVAAYGVPMLFMSIFQCHPGPGQFFSRPMYCFNLTDLLISSTTFHAITDAWLILIIMPSISGLDLPAKQKVTLSIVLNFGIFVIAAGVVRLMLCLRKGYRPDMVGVTTSLAFFIMTVLECDLAIICASAPTLRPLFAKVFPWIMHDARRRSLQPRSRGRPAPYVSVDLTSQLSYHGYPWTRGTTPRERSRNPSQNPSVGSHLNKLHKRFPHPPVPALNISHRTPTSLSLRSMMPGMGPKSGTPPSVNTDGRPILDESRPVSMVTSGNGNESIGRPSMTIPWPLSPPPRRYGHDDWRKSQESLVMGLNDPLSPTSLSPPPPISPASARSSRSYPTLMDHWERAAERESRRESARKDAEREKGLEEEKNDTGDMA